jgi:hypothetical protein
VDALCSLMNVVCEMSLPFLVSRSNVDEIKYCVN